jgi:hypothetical protein
MLNLSFNSYLTMTFTVKEKCIICQARNKFSFLTGRYLTISQLILMSFSRSNNKIHIGINNGSFLP